jgi:hypothetical protein
MIETTSGGSHFSTNYINKNQSINSLTYQENDRTVQQEKFQFTTDQVNLTYSAESVTTYNRSMSLESKVGDGYDLLRGLVLNIFKEQGIDYKIATDSSEIDISTVTPEEAQELIADDGYFGVEKTLERIFKFAVAMAGGDPSRTEAIREGVENGFQEALDAFGGRLPDISYDTYDAVMKKLDDWAGVEISPQSQI